MTKQNGGEPQELEYESVPTVQTFFEVQGGGPVVQRIARLIAPAVHLLFRMIAYLVTRMKVRGKITVLTAVMFAANPAAAQDCPPSGLQSVPTPAIVLHQNVSKGNVVLGSTAGWALGLHAGIGLAVLVQPDAGDSWLGAGEWWLAFSLYQLRR